MAGCSRIANIDIFERGDILEVSKDEKVKTKKNTESKESDKENEKILEKLKSENEKLNDELSKNKEVLLRTAAEYDNFRKRTEKEKMFVYGNAVASTVLGMLPVADSLDAAIDSASNMSDEYKKGIELIKNQMIKSLKSLNVESFAEVGEEFDPNIHNAISHCEEESEEKNIISKVFQKGYKIGDKVIRHAMVQVKN